MASPNFGRPDVDYYGEALPGIESLRGLFKSGRLTASGEVQAQYEGLSPSDPSLDSYFALAETLDVPVGIHTGSSFPGTPYQGYPRFRLTLGNPLLVEELLIRHPKLRVFIAHGGGHWSREAIALMQMYPQVYADVGAIWLLASFDSKAVDAWLQELIAGGLGDRIMFGTDQMRWPETIGMGIDVIQSSKTLTDQQERDILYNNAARFLRLSKPAPEAQLSAWQRSWSPYLGPSAPGRSPISCQRRCRRIRSPTSENRAGHPRWKSVDEGAARGSPRVRAAGQPLRARGQNRYAQGTADKQWPRLYRA